ncbi:hypothetical protein [Streptomyces syringium]|uniref:Uncharacterized protein n=1 Tax=Streptomyces syringium TaxID=76729 RepID=A0ABS4XWV0_9ACTN|nr:hypothetical protein [Streptomyces syringium]MBP2400984.1 hypothetical protein [Streptomyces syringium]
MRGIRTLLAAGLGTTTIGELLPCMVDAGEELVPAYPEMLPDLYRERQRISDAVADLLAARGVLDTSITPTLPLDALEPPACEAVGSGRRSGA